MSAERETIDFDVLFVGGGPASLSGALHLSRLIKAHNKKIDEGKKEGKKFDETQITVIEKGPEVGMHSLSGAVMDPIGIQELIPDFEEQGFPFERRVTSDSLYFLTERHAFKAPFLPPAFHNNNFYIISLFKVVRWLAELVEASGVNIFSGFPGVELLYEGESVVGVRTGDKGVDQKGNQKPQYEQGVDLKAKVTVLGEGPRGTLTKQLVSKFNLSGVNPQIYSAGVKEVWEVPQGNLKEGRVIHTAGYPLPSTMFGGGFLYSMDKGKIALGHVTALDYEDPSTDPHYDLQRYKQHPLISTILKGGKLLHYGAKTISEGGFYSLPEFFVDGCLLIGGSAGFLNARRLKGVHLAIKSGILAAEAIFDALCVGVFSKDTLKEYKKKIDGSWVREELYEARNFRQGFQDGFYKGALRTGIEMVCGSGSDTPVPCDEDHTHMKKFNESNEKQRDKTFDDQLTFSKLTDVYYSGTQHEKDQPCHLKIADVTICNGKCKTEFGNPCQYFCPANVYEMVDEDQSGELSLKLNPENCVHCKTCDIADPYGIITWVPPEGGGGPRYNNM